MVENKNAKTPADDGQPVAWCNGMPAYEGPLSKKQHKHLVQDLDAPLTLNGVPLYPAPQKKEWVGLTDEEIQDLGYLSEKFDASNSEWFDRWGFARYIEAKLREKNT
jgi:hypothetical protein